MLFLEENSLRKENKMALSKEITDSRGVRCTYHRIAAFSFDAGKLYIKIASYVSEMQREQEKTVISENQAFLDFQAETVAQQELLDQKSRLLASMPVSSDPERIILESEVIELSAQYNDRLNGAQPQFTEPEDRSYSSRTIELSFDPTQILSLESLYEQLLETELFNGATSV